MREAVASKFDTINTEMMKNEEDVVIISSPESIAWLLNIRGSDVARTPLPLSFLMLNKEGHAKAICRPKKNCRRNTKSSWKCECQFYQLRSLAPS